MGKSSSSRCCKEPDASKNPLAPNIPPPAITSMGARTPTLAHASFFFTASFSGSTFKANLRFRTVHSWPQNTFCKGSGEHPASHTLLVPDPTLLHPSACSPEDGHCHPISPPNISPPQAGGEMQGAHRLLRQSPQHLGEVGVHLLRRPLEELPAASHEQGVTCGVTRGWAQGGPQTHSRTGEHGGFAPGAWGGDGVRGSRVGVPEKRAGASGEPSSHMK